MPSNDQPTSHTYPVTIRVNCDNDRTSFEGEFTVSDDMTQEQRFDVVRKHLTDVEGWSCTDDGYFCPACKPTEEQPS
ncbi:hypothetical protein [Streptomyces sp. V1I1]|uniref:hypothetical protein n=1 Tax=Streptomyces sp. V1I1 TaxID=3042272 RepID=UPI002789734A|nr:hypothetical protein [Streptomyces sp. V1I1]MDQ0943303.1 hypothetical protein [Streptomyces sp. V1I1]